MKIQSLIRFLDTSERIVTPVKFNRWQILLIYTIFLAAALSQLWTIDDLYSRVGETGFQELIARRHVDLGLLETNGLSTISHCGPDPVYHPTHPPLLQLVLAGLYSALGDSETTARLIPFVSTMLILVGLWRLARFYLTPNGQIVLLLAALVIPLSFQFGRIVNFEQPALACIVWTMVFIELINRQASRHVRSGLLLTVVTGSLIDWPYQLFVTCLFVTALWRRDRTSVYFKAVWRVWALSMTISAAYALAVYGLGAMYIMAHHVKVQSGTFDPRLDALILPAIVSVKWWQSLLVRITAFGTPILSLTFAIWLLWGFKHRFRTGLHHWCFVLFLFAGSYFCIFSRAAYHHDWCLFYLTPLLCLTFGLVVERFNSWIGPAAVFVILFSLPMDRDWLTKKPNLSSVQFGQSIASALDFLPKEKRTMMAGPLLYVNRVDPLPYYAHCETGFSHLTAGVAKPDQFLLRLRPEYVALTDYRRQSPITVKAEFSNDFFNRLEKSYSLVHEQGKTELWESLWSPNLSLMGMIRDSEGNKQVTSIIDDGNSVHIGSRAQAGNKTVQIDLNGIPKPGRRWLHGWVIAQGSQTMDPIQVTVRTNDESVLGSIDVIPQSAHLRWQEFWLYIGQLPDRISFSWQGTLLIWGDVRLVSEVLMVDDLTRVLAGEIRRLNSAAYDETFILKEKNAIFYPILQHPGFGVDEVALPPIRVGLDQTLEVTYGVNPTMYEKTDGIVFRMSVRDHAIKKELLFEDFLCPATNPKDREWRTRRIPLEKHSRHLLTFTFEVDPGPDGDETCDHALWREVKIVSRR